MEIKLLTDVSAELDAAYVKENDVTVLKMPVSYDNVEVEDIEISKFWNLLKEGKKVKTSQPNREDIKEEFLKAKDGGYALICVFISAALSGTIATAESVKAEIGYDKIYIVDSLKATLGENIVAKKAVTLIKEGLAAEEIYEKLKNFASRVRLMSSVDSLKYLALGGRLSTIAAAIGNLIGIKPVVTIDVDGKVKVLSKKIGLRLTMKEILNIIGKEKIDESEPVIPIYACDDENVLAFVEKFKEVYKTATLTAPAEIGYVVGTHIGPGGFGAVYVVKE